MITVIDSHNKVLLAWAKYRNTLKHPPRLITLDHHTDTSPPFRSLIKKTNVAQDDAEFKRIQQTHLSKINYKDLKTVTEAIDKLSNDEHIIAAIKSNIISSSFILAHNAMNTDLETYREYKIACRTISDSDTAIESFKLDEAILEFDSILQINNEAPLAEEPFILDIDLDYFNTFQSITPGDLSSFKTLTKTAGLITIATEPEYVKICALDVGLTSEYLLGRMLKHLADSGH